MEEITIKAEFLFEFISKNHWINSAAVLFGDLQNRRDEQTICVASNGAILTIGLDFRIAADESLYPVKAYRLVRVSELVH